MLRSKELLRRSGRRTPLPLVLATGFRRLGCLQAGNRCKQYRLGLSRLFVATALAVPLSSRAAEEKPRIIDICPPVVYPSKDTSAYVFTILGENFGGNATDMALELSCGGIQTNLIWGTAAPSDFRPYGQLVNSRQINVSNLSRPEHTRGLKLYILRGQQRSEGFELKLSHVGRRTPAIYAGLLALAVLFILWSLLTVLAKQRQWNWAQAKVDDKSYGPLRTFLLDRQTDTYSLSRFQLLIWTIVGVYGYVYLLFARWLIQGDFELADVPKNFPTLLLISGGTAALAQGVTSLRGPNGSGDVQPGWQDFISAGGQIAAERLQLFVWTLLGAVAFLLLLVARDPGGLRELPPIPEQLLYLMGFSATAYLGGKLARKPGPVIDDIRAETTNPKLVLTIRGTNLHKDASFRMDNVDLNQANFPDNYDYAVDLGEKDPQGDSPDSFKILKLTFHRPKPDWTKRKTVFTVVNRDGQKADWPLPAGFRVVVKSVPIDAVKLSAVLKVINDELKNPEARRQIEQAGAVARNIVVLKDVTEKEAQEQAAKLDNAGAVVSVEASI